MSPTLILPIKSLVSKLAIPHAGINRLIQGSKIALVRSYLRVPQGTGQVNILIFLVKITFFPLYANNFCDAGQLPILRYFETCYYGKNIKKNFFAETKRPTASIFSMSSGPLHKSFQSSPLGPKWSCPWIITSGPLTYNGDEL